MNRARGITRDVATPVYTITSADEGTAARVGGRQTRYLISMGIRTACFLGAIAATGWLRWALLAGAILLPYFSVVVANAGRERAESLPVVVLDSRRRALERARESAKPPS